MKEVIEKHGDDVRIVFKHNPLSFHDKAQLAAEASLEAHAQGKFWEYHDKLFQDTKKIDRPNLEIYAEEVGLDMDAFRKALDEGTHKDHITRDQELAAAVGATGTPTFFINGRKVEGGNTYDNFKEYIEEEKAHAQKLLDKGTPIAELYDKIIAKGKIQKALEDEVYSFDFEGSPMIGKAPARITITEFSEFQ